MPTPVPGKPHFEYCLSWPVPLDWFGAALTRGSFPSSGKALQASCSLRFSSFFLFVLPPSLLRPELKMSVFGAVQNHQALLVDVW